MTVFGVGHAFHAQDANGAAGQFGRGCECRFSHERGEHRLDRVIEEKSAALPVGLQENRGAMSGALLRASKLLSIEGIPDRKLSASPCRPCFKRSFSDDAPFHVELYQPAQFAARK